MGPHYFLDKTIGGCAMGIYGLHWRVVYNVVTEVVRLLKDFVVYMISCAMTCEFVGILLFLSLRQSKGVLVVGWKIFFWIVLDLVIKSV